MVGAAEGRIRCLPKERIIMARRKYTREFKLSAVQLVNGQGDSVVDAAKSLWESIPTASAGGSPRFPVSRGWHPAVKGALAAELHRLRKENARLVMERDILKKAAAFFAKEQL